MRSAPAGLLDLRAAQAAERDTLVVAIGDTINSLDIQRAGTNRPAYQVAINCYDRLISLGTTTDPSGDVVSDYQTLRGELAASWAVAADGLSVTFKLKPDAAFSDGTPVTADDVKWSFDRAVSIGGFPTGQFAIGRMTSADQFTVVDPHTITVSFPLKSKLSLPDFAVPLAIVYNSKVAKEHATPADPWAAADDEKFGLYVRYLKARHDWSATGSDPADGDARESFESFLYRSPVPAVEFCYRSATGRLLAVGICDLCPTELSSVYFFFDPNEARRGLGTFGGLYEIRWAATRGLAHYYLGFWVRGDPAMAYKSRFGPFEILTEAGDWELVGHA